MPHAPAYPPLRADGEAARMNLPRFHAVVKTAHFAKTSSTTEEPDSITRDGDANAGLVMRAL
jgi:hypothetical protein